MYNTFFIAGSASSHTSLVTRIWSKYEADERTHEIQVSDNVDTTFTHPDDLTTGPDVMTTAGSYGYGWGQVSPSPISCPDNWHNFYASSCYFVAYPHYDNYEDSQTECDNEQSGSYLAELTTTEEFDAVVAGARDVMAHL